MEHPARIGKYEIEQYLGGGMARVYRARDSVLGRHVALKILAGNGAADAEAKARFLFEARTASNITHENIISVYDFGEDEGRPFIVMEFLEGESLRDAIKNGHLGDFRRRVKIALQIARAVDFIHTKKIIHRDIKPENIHVTPDAKAKLMDFGIAKAEGVNFTRAGFTVGTPYYMAPEQVLGQALTRQSDVYSFGILLFELLTGVRPVNGDNVQSIFDQILKEPLNMAPIKALKLSPSVADLIERCTAKQPAQRPEGLGAVCDEIELILNPGAAPVKRPVEKPPPAPPSPRRTEIVLTALVAVGVVAIALLIYRILR